MKHKNNTAYPTPKASKRTSFKDCFQVLVLNINKSTYSLDNVTTVAIITAFPTLSTIGAKVNIMKAHAKKCNKPSNLTKFITAKKQSFKK